MQYAQIEVTHLSTTGRKATERADGKSEHLQRLSTSAVNVFTVFDDSMVPGELLMMLPKRPSSVTDEVQSLINRLCMQQPR